MGYTTDFEGSLILSRQLNDVEKKYINSFSATRRMKRHVNVLMEMYKGEFGNPFPAEQTPEAIYGVDGEYFVNEDRGGNYDSSVVDINTPPGNIGYKEMDNFNECWKINKKRVKEGICQPGLWCQWIINDDNELAWDGGEKFYSYTEWLKYLINHFFEKWGVKLNGTISWQGEDNDDFGKIVVKNNTVAELIGHKVYNDKQ